ncbi:MAG TPA: amidase family protein, partial [Pseudomonadales bacterium]
PVIGPMARTVSDAALLLSVMAGPDRRDPLTLADDPAVFASDLASDPGGLRVAFSEDLGFLPVERAVRKTFRAAQPLFDDIGCRVAAAHPDLRDAPEIFQTLRAYGFAASFGRFLEEHPDKLKDTVRWNTALGLELTGRDVARAQAGHLAVYRRMLRFFEDHDFLVLPSTQVLPFAKTEEWVREIEGVRFDNYLQWMEICGVITLTGCPVAAVPCGFSQDGLPVGLQIVGPPGEDLAVLRLAHAFEEAAPFAAQPPPF